MSDHPSADLTGAVEAVHLAAEHQFSKHAASSITLLAGLGVEGDAHLGATVKHRSRVARDPLQPNLRQVHLVASELLDEVNSHGHELSPGILGENITTSGIDLMALPVGSMLSIGDSALVAITGARNPCLQIRDLGDGVLKLMFVENPDGSKTGRLGIMGMVVDGGAVGPGDTIAVRYPAGELRPLELI